MLFAIDPVTTVQGPLGGWDVVILQFGAFGLLTYVIVVLAPQILRELMAERKQRDQAALEERAKREKAEREERRVREDTFVKVVDVLETKFGDRNALIIRQMEMEREACRLQYLEQMNAHKETRHRINNLGEQIGLMADMAWQESEEKGVVSQRQRRPQTVRPTNDPDP